MSLPGGIWQRVREVRRRVGEIARDLAPEVRDAAVMVAAELVENAIKYGESTPGCEDIEVHVRIETERVVIEVHNGVSNPATTAELSERIRQISESDDREALYVGRLTEMLSEPGQSSKLGLYRMGFEGKFTLEYQVDDQVLKVRATRVLHDDF